MSKKLSILWVGLLVLASCGNKNDYDATGTFEATEITISAEANGKILSFPVQEGDTVKAGEVLCSIDSLQLVLQRQQILLQQQALLASKPDVQQQVASLRQQIQKQEKELLRLQKMYQGHAATGKQVDDMEAQIEMLHSQLDATLQTLNSGNMSVNNSAAALEIQMKSVSDMIGKCSVKAPAYGMVMVKYAEAGEMAVMGKPLLKIADLRTMYLRAYLTSDQLAEVKIGQEVKVIADFGGDKQKEYPGKITWISTESEFTPKGIQTRDSRANLVYAVKIAVQNDGLLKIGLYGEVKL